MERGCRLIKMLKLRIIIIFYVMFCNWIQKKNPEMFGKLKCES